MTVPSLLTKAVKESGLARVINEREISIIDYPTVKIHVRYQAILPEIESILKQVKVRMGKVRKSII